MFQITPSLILGSKSPRRRAILTQLGIPYQLAAPSFIEEVPQKHHISQKMIPEYFATQKALHISKLHPSALILGFDTVILHQTRILGKPCSKQNAFEMLLSLNNRSHEVITGVALALNGKILYGGSESTKVFFNDLPKDLIRLYAFSEEPKDKAGAYAIQGQGAFLVRKIEGCYYNVVGLPVSRTFKILQPYTNLKSGK